MSFTKKKLQSTLALAVVVSVGAGTAPAFASTGDFTALLGFQESANSGKVNDLAINDGKLTASVNGASSAILSVDLENSGTSSSPTVQGEIGALKSFNGVQHATHNSDTGSGYISNAGAGWQETGSPLTKTSDVAQDANGFTWLVGETDEGVRNVYLTVDAGATWGKSLTSYDASSFQWIAEVNGKVYMEGEVYGDTGIYVYDGGWNKVSATPTGETDSKKVTVFGDSIYFGSGVVFNTATFETTTADYGVGDVTDFFADSEGIYAAGTSGVTASTDGVGWESVSENLPENVTAIALDETKLYVGTNDGKLKIADLGGGDIPVVINEAPVLEGVKDLTVPFGSVFNAKAGVSASDVEDGDITSSITVAGNVDTYLAGEYKLVYTVVDSAGQSSTASSVVTVEEAPNELPAFKGIVNHTIEEGQSVDLLAGVTAQDKEDGNLTADIKVDKGTLDTNTPGEYTVTYTVTDSKGESVTAKATVKVEAKVVVPEPEPEVPQVPINAAPVIKSDSRIKIDQGASVKELLAKVSATDVEDGDISNKVTILGKVDLSKRGVATVVFTVSDRAGATSTKSVLVEVVKKNTSPWITGVKDETLKKGEKFDPSKGVTAHDREDKKIKLNIWGKVDTNKVGTYALVYSATDSSGKTVMKVKTVKVVDSKNKGKHSHSHKGHSYKFDKGDNDKSKHSYDQNKSDKSNKSGKK